jgi:hypothetical protein
MSKVMFYLFLAIFSAGILGCSLALDIDALSQGGEDTNSDGQDTDSCASNAECDDGVDCTVDVCNEDGTCANAPDDALCEYLEFCDPEDGCVDSGYDCLEQSDCDDEIDCTVDMCLNHNCYNEPDDSLCVNEDNLCVINRVCIEDVGCSPGEMTECDQTGLDPCEESVCNPSTGECEEGVAVGADDDEDGYLDVECGGDDCNDAVSAINAGAAELCNLIDDDCDGITDAAATAGPVEVFKTGNLQVSDLAYDSERFAIVWQSGEGDLSEVYAQILGTGECLVDTICIDGDGLPAFQAVNLTSKGGLNSSGADPSITSDGDTFLVAWTAIPQGESPRVILVEIEYDTDTMDVRVSDAEQLSSGDAKEIISPQLEWNENLFGWVAAWGRVFSDDTVAVEFIDEISHDEVLVPFAGQQETGQMEGLSLAPLGSDECVVAYSFRESTETDLEVYEADLVFIGNAGNAWGYETGWPKMISASSDTLEDPSSQATVARTGVGAWVTAFADVQGGTAPEDESDIRCVQSDPGDEILDIIKDNAFSQQSPRIVYDGVNFGILYSQDVGSGSATLDFRMLDSSLAKLPDQGARFAHLTPGELRSSALIPADSGFAAVWIESEDTEDTLRFAGFKGCELSP